MTKTYTPTPELLAIPEPDRIRWAEALESGEYEQTFAGSLFDSGSYCCLGVWDQINDCIYKTQEQYESHGSFLAFYPLSKIPNFDVKDHRLPRAAECDGLDYAFHTLNDSLYFTFPQIAQLLRGNEIKQMIELKFDPHPDLLATPFDERIEWCGYLDERSQAVCELKNNYGSVCCLGALAEGRGASIDINTRTSSGYVMPYYQLGEGFNAYLNDSAICGNDEIDFEILNDRYKFTFPEIQELLKGRSVTKRYEQHP